MLRLAQYMPHSSQLWTGNRLHTAAAMGSQQGRNNVDYDVGTARIGAGNVERVGRRSNACRMSG